MESMASAEGQSGGACTTYVPALDAESAEWLRALRGSEADKHEGQMRLHTLLVQIAHAEVRRRSSHLEIVGPELDDIAYQAAADAMVKIIAKLGEFRGESRFT